MLHGEPNTTASVGSLVTGELKRGGIGGLIGGSLWRRLASFNEAATTRHECVCVLQAYSCTYTHTTTAVATFFDTDLFATVHFHSRHCAMRAQRAYLQKIHMPHSLDLGSQALPTEWILDLGCSQRTGSWILGIPGRLDLGSWSGGSRTASRVDTTEAKC